MPVMLTYVALAAGSGGATNPATALANTWAQFSTGSGPANVQTWDRRSMNYYSAGFTSCALNASYVVQNLIGPTTPPSPPTIAPYNSAQCGAFALLLESALAMNGIHSNWVTVQAADGLSLMVINNWSPGTPSLSIGAAPWQYNFSLNGCPLCGIDFMVPVPASYGDLTNCTGGSTGCNGLPGQGSTVPPLTGYPLEKVFNKHFIVQVCFNLGFMACQSSGNLYYDPSYGVTYSSTAGCVSGTSAPNCGPANFEAQSVAGYAQQFGTAELGTSNYQFRLAIVPLLGPNISFSPLSGSSM